MTARDVPVYWVPRATPQVLPFVRDFLAIHAIEETAAFRKGLRRLEPSMWSISVAGAPHSTQRPPSRAKTSARTLSGIRRAVSG